MLPPVNVYSIVSRIKDLVNISSPTGNTTAVVEYLRNFAVSHSIEHHITKKGAIIYQFASGDKAPQVAFTAHVDTLGAMVKEIKDGLIKIVSIGGYPAIYVVGEGCTLNGIRGTILPNNPAVHVNRKLGDEKLTYDDISVRIDLKEQSDDELKNRFPVGTFVGLDPRFEESNGFIKSRHLDDKASVAVLMVLAEMFAKKPGLKAKTPAFQIIFNVTEETGQGLAGLDSNVADLIVVDMGVVGDGVAGDEYSVSICAKDSSGPYNAELTRKLIDLAVGNNIGHKVDIFPFYGSDGSAALRAGVDCRVALIGQGVSASHGYERTHRDGLENTLNLILAYLLESDDRKIKPGKRRG